MTRRGKVTERSDYDYACSQLSHVISFARRFPCKTPVERSERVAGCWAVRARANPLSLGVWHFTLRLFCLELGWLHPSRRQKGCGLQSPVFFAPHGMQEWSPRVICCRTRDFRSGDGACRGLARRRQASPLAPTPGANNNRCLLVHKSCILFCQYPRAVLPYPRAARSRTSSHATLFRSRAVFPADSGRMIRARGGGLGC